MNFKTIENKALLVSSSINFINALAGVVVYIITGLNALLLDSVFSIIGFIASVAAIYISKNSHKKTEHFPNGMYFLEPLFGVLKSIATLMLLLVAFWKVALLHLHILLMVKVTLLLLVQLFLIL